MAETTKHYKQKDLLAYAQDFLEPDEHRAMEEHLRGCADCQKLLEEVRHFLPAVRQVLTPQEMPTEEMWAKVQTQFRNRPPAKEPFFTRIRIALAAGGAALATTILLVAQPLLRQAEMGFASRHQNQGGYVAAPQRPQSQGGIVSAPRRPTPADAGPDGGMPMDGGTTAP